MTMRYTIKYRYNGEIKETKTQFVYFEHPTYIKFRKVGNWVMIPWTNIVLILDEGWKTLDKSDEL